MARVTVEDCVRKIPNRFELVVLASERVRDILSGAPIEVDRDNDKNPVIALREIAQGVIVEDQLVEQLIKGHQKYAPIEDEDEEEILESLAEEQSWISDPESTTMAEEIKEDDLHCVDSPVEEIQE